MKSGNLRLTASMIEVLIAVSEGSTTLESLQANFSKSKSWVSRVVDILEKQGFLRKFGTGRLVRIEYATTPHSIAFRNMYVDQPHRNYSTIFVGKNLDVLLALATGEKNTKTIGNMMRVQARTIRARIQFLASKGLLTKKGRRYAISSQQEKVIAFLKSVRNFSKNNGIVLWKFGCAELLQTHKQSDTKGELTGFNQYGKYGVEINTTSYLYYIPKTLLSAEEIFIHSLFEINDQRTFAIAVTLYVKQKLYVKRKKENIFELAEMFDKLELAQHIITAYDMIKNNKIEELPLTSLIDMKEIHRMFTLYDVQDV